MKLIFLTLIVINALIAIWGLFIREQVVVGLGGPSQPVIEAQVKTITSTNPSSVSAAGDGSAGNEKRLCELVGPFSGDEDADVFAERLRAIDISSSVDHIELSAGSSYWVHLSPEETKAAAYRKLAELQSLKIESYVIGSGDLQNAVALGVFTKEQHAEKTRDSLVEQGFSPVITVKARTEIEIWITIQPEFAEKISEITWQNLLEGMTSQERRQNYCLPVAS